MAATYVGRLWDATVTLLAAQGHQLPSDSSAAPSEPFLASETALEVTGPRYVNVWGVPCVVPLVTHEFADSYWHPAVVDFAPPLCDEDYSVAYVKWAVTCPPGVQFDRIAAVWVNGVELLRTSTAEPSRQAGVSWEVVKDVSLYGDVVREGGVVVVALDNIVNPTYTSSFTVQLSLEFYRPLDSSKEIKQPDLVVPLSSHQTSYGWFTEKPTGVKNGPPYHLVKLPENTEEVYLELFLSQHQCDEFYYANPPDSYAETSTSGSNATSGDTGTTATGGDSLCGGGGPFREVQVLVDDELVGVVWPFALVFTGGFNPYLWKPIVSIGAFDAPTYLLNLTPFLGKFLTEADQPHVVVFRVVYGEAFWLIDGNLLVFEDKGATRPTQVEVLEERLGRYVAPTVATMPTMTASTNGSNTVSNTVLWASAARELYVRTSVTTSTGTKIYTLQQQFDFTNTQMYSADGLDQWFESHTHVDTTMTVTSFPVWSPATQHTQMELERPAPPKTVLVSQTEDYPLAGSVHYRAGKNGSFMLITEFSNMFTRSTAMEGNGIDFRYGYTPGKVHATLTTSATLDSRFGGGNGSTRATSASASPVGGCFYREVTAEFGRLVSDNSNTKCQVYA
ncbi:hypothetical protein BBJ28_00007559 [Nothophytophthora sp. Chile5]|nr:hypothetical protein BBJ28_00007559 [Nothophytophthora sp. Chile5]